MLYREIVAVGSEIPTPLPHLGASTRFGVMTHIRGFMITLIYITLGRTPLDE